MRLQAYLARAGVAPSRRKGEALILAGRVSVNGGTASLGASVSPREDLVLLEGRPVTLPAEATHLALNKPRGYLTTTDDERGRPTVVELVPEVPGLVPVGRLDADTTGLLILTNDGPLAHRVAHPSSRIEKEYRLTVRNPAPERALRALAAGPVLEDGKILPPKLGRVRRTTRETSLDLAIHEGRNRIIRRACAAVGLAVVSLHRIRVGPVRLGGLPEGGYRSLRPEELAGLR